MIKHYVAGYKPGNAIWGIQAGYSHSTFEPAAADAERKTKEQGTLYKVYKVTIKEIESD